VFPHSDSNYAATVTFNGRWPIGKMAARMQKKSPVSNMPPHFAKFDLFLALMFYGTMVVVKIDS
jgi:hypothetical protein